MAGFYLGLKGEIKVMCHRKFRSYQDAEEYALEVKKNVEIYVKNKDMLFEYEIYEDTELEDRKDVEIGKKVYTDCSIFHYNDDHGTLKPE